GMTRGIAPLILGYQAFDEGVRIAGVILNRVGGPRHEGKLRAALERYTDVPMLGAIARESALEIPERHLGLAPANELDSARETIGRLAESIGRQVDLDRLREIAATAEGPGAALAQPLSRAHATDLRIGIARDAAFGFYYPGDLEALEAAGAELVPFNTLTDPRLPRVDALFIGGGFPEIHMAALEANATLRAEIRTAIESGMPAYAECGGLMYLSRGLTWNGESREMVGAIPGDAVMHDRPRGRGYVLLEETADAPWPAQPGTRGPAGLPSHEFHYASLENLPGDTLYAWRVLRGHGLDGERDGVIVANLLASFCHLRDTGAHRWAARFAAFARQIMRGESPAARHSTTNTL
ncbi:MAG: cobyrinate a,c-diamide synthase, partial [Alphaproteobacteria bacterium]